jgi:hypothetical protein
VFVRDHASVFMAGKTDMLITEVAGLDSLGAGFLSVREGFLFVWKLSY